MADVKRPLERESERFDLPVGALDRMYERRRLRQRRERAITIAISVVIILALGAAAASLRAGMPGNIVPGDQMPSPSIEGTWRSDPITRSMLVRAFVAAGGTRDEGRAFFDQLGGGTSRAAEIILLFRSDGTFSEFESADGKTAVGGYGADVSIRDDGTLSMRAPGCRATYAYAVGVSTLRLQPVAQCPGHDGPYNTTLFASFPFTRTT